MYAIIDKEKYICKGYVLTSLNPSDRESVKLPLIFDDLATAELVFREFRFKESYGFKIVKLSRKHSHLVDIKKNAYSL